MLWRKSWKAREDAGYLYVSFRGSLTLEHGEEDDEALGVALEPTSPWLFDGDCVYEVRRATLAHHVVL